MHLNPNEALKYGTCGMDLDGISIEVLEAVQVIADHWGRDAGRRVVGLHPSDRVKLVGAINEVLWRRLNDHALFLRDHAGEA
jgi:hypothetical protein